MAVNRSVECGVAKWRETCSYFAFCGGGSPSNKIVETGSFDVAETRSCRLRVKVPVSAFIDSLERRGKDLATSGADADGLRP